jgi:UDP-N-acetylmuramyl pentapeptide phosphotransferase/UDP-N-acetylglucosamine-1-phosphate transferase
MVLVSIGLLIISSICTYFGIHYFRLRSLQKNWLDFPNERSSHHSPTPRGAGLIIVFVALAAYLTLVYFTNARFLYGYFIGVMIVSGISWLDDLYSLSFVWRLLAHLSAAILFVQAHGFCTVLGTSGNAVVLLPPVGKIVTVIWIVWIINAYNFMDGIDGLAGIQGVIAAGTWAFIAFGLSTTVYLFCLVILGSLAAFLVHNWQPARVFMGDVGSAFLGYTFATLPLMVGDSATIGNGFLPIAAVLILWPFILDSVLTLARRVFRGERVWQAHREHLYQRLVMVGFSHAVVSVIYGVFAVVSAVAAILVQKYTEWIGEIALVSVVIVSLVFTIAVLQLSRIKTLKFGSDHV